MRAQGIGAAGRGGTPDIDHEEKPALNVLMILEEDELPLLPAGSSVDDGRIDSLVGVGRTVAAEAVNQGATRSLSARRGWRWLTPDRARCRARAHCKRRRQRRDYRAKRERISLRPKPQRADPRSTLSEHPRGPTGKLTATEPSGVSYWHGDTAKAGE